MSTYTDPAATPAEGTPAAHLQRLRAKLAQMPAAVDGNGNPVTAAAAPAAAPVFDALGTVDPATAVAVLKAADALGVDHATVNTLMDSASFVAGVTGAAPDVITAAITARTTTAPRMAPNPAQGQADAQPVQPTQTFADKARATLNF